MSWSTPVVTVEPASEPITIEQARRQVRLAADDTGFDAELTDYIKAARAHVEQYCGTPLVARTIETQADGFADLVRLPVAPVQRSEEHTSELQSLMRISYAVFCLKKKKLTTQDH